MRKEYANYYQTAKQIVTTIAEGKHPKEHEKYYQLLPHDRTVRERNNQKTILPTMPTMPTTTTTTTTTLPNVVRPVNPPIFYKNGTLTVNKNSGG
jgi:hypothetical protein